MLQKHPLGFECWAALEDLALQAFKVETMSARTAVVSGVHCMLPRCLELLQGKGDGKGRDDSFQEPGNPRSLESRLGSLSPVKSIVAKTPAPQRPRFQGWAHSWHSVPSGDLRRVLSHFRSLGN